MTGIARRWRDEGAGGRVCVSAQTERCVCALTQTVPVVVRRRSAVGKLILGSNAHDILLAADCPVLAVKTPHT